MVGILGQNNIDKLTKTNVYDLLTNVSDKDQMARILGPDNINKLSGDNVKDLLKYVNKKDDVGWWNKKYYYY